MIHDAWFILHLYDVGYNDDIDAASAFQTWTRISMKLFWVPWMKHQQLPSCYHIPIHLPHISKISCRKFHWSWPIFDVPQKTNGWYISPSQLIVPFAPKYCTSTTASRIRKISPKIQRFTAPLSGWWLSPTPLKNDGVRQLGWHSQLDGKIIQMFQNHQLNQSLIFHSQRLNHH